MPRYSPHKVPEGFIIGITPDGSFILLRTYRPFVYEQVGGPYKERWYAIKRAEQFQQEGKEHHEDH